MSFFKNEQTMIMNSGGHEKPVTVCSGGNYKDKKKKLIDVKLFTAGVNENQSE